MLAHVMPPKRQIAPAMVVPAAASLRDAGRSVQHEIFVDCSNLQLKVADHERKCWLKAVCWRTWQDVHTAGAAGAKRLIHACSAGDMGAKNTPLATEDTHGCTATTHGYLVLSPMCASCPQWHLQSGPAQIRYYWNVSAASCGAAASTVWKQPARHTRSSAGHLKLHDMLTAPRR